MLLLISLLASAGSRDLRPHTANTAVTSSARIALVIGNGRYSDASARLDNPTNDAALMARTLRELGFEVIVATDLDRDALKRAIDRFGTALEAGGVGVFYYAGHGLQVDGRNWLVPVDASIASQADVEFEAVDANRVLAKMEGANNGLNIVILDACRNNPFERSWRSGRGSGLASINAPAGTLLAYATAPGDVAADGSSGNSPYAASLAESMRQSGVELSSVFRNTRSTVLSETSGQQTPWESSSYTGDFYFQPAETAPAPVASVSTPAPPAPIQQPEISTGVGTICWFYDNTLSVRVNLRGITTDRQVITTTLTNSFIKQPTYQCSEHTTGSYTVVASGTSAVGAENRHSFDLQHDATVFVKVSAYKRSLSVGTIGFVSASSERDYTEARAANPEMWGPL